MAEAIVLGLGGFASAGAATAALGTVGYNLTIAGVSLGLSVATSAIVSALTPLPPSPKQSILVNARDGAAPQEFVYGETRKGGITTYYESTRKGSVLYQIIAVAAHEVESIDAIYVNDKQVTLSTDSYDNGSRSGAGWVTDQEWTSDDTEHEIRIFYHLGDQTAITDTFANSSVETLDSVFFDTGSADEDSQNFGGIGQPTKASFVGNGIAYIFVRYGFNAGVFSKGLPLITCKLKGKKVYDPRTTSTAYSNNAALCIRDYLTSAYGLNDPNVDDTVFSAAANTCDEDVTLDAGGTEKRYTLNGVVKADQSYGDVLQQMITSCGGTLFWGGGKWKLGVGEYNAPTKVLTLDDLRSNISLQTRTNLRDQFNRVQGVFTDSSNRYLVADYPPIESATFLAQDDGVEQTLDLDLPFTTSSATAQRLAKQVLFRGREQMVFSADFGLNAFDVEVGEIVALTVERYGWTEKEFEVVGWNFNSSSEGGDLRVTLTLRETSSAAFDWDAEESEIISNDSDLVTTLEPVGNLTATFDGTVSVDGTFLNGILIDWDSVVGSTGYEVEWTVNNSIDYAANGGIVEEADAVTTREQFIYKGYIELLYRQPDQDGFDFYNTGGGSGLDEAAFRAQLAASPERASLKFSGLVVQNPTTEYTIKPALDNTIYNIRVRAVNNNGVKSLWRSVTFTTVPDNTIPSAPANLTAIGGTRAIKLSWDKVTTNTDASAANDIFLYAIYRGTSTNPTTLVDTTAGEGWSDVGLSAATTYYYRVKAIDFSGNESTFSLNASATTDAAALDGADGDRGPGRWYIDVDGIVTLPTTEANADNIWNAVSGSGGIPVRPVVYDQVIFYNGTESNPTKQQAFICTSVFSDTSHTWNEQEELIDGDLLVTGTVTTDKLNVLTLSAITANLGTVTAGTIDIISGARSALIEPNGSFEVLDVAGSGLQTVGRFVQTSSASTGDVLEIRKEGASGAGLFIDCTATGSQDGIVVETLGGAGSTAGEFNNTRINSGHIQLALNSADGGYAAFAVDGDYLVNTGHSYLPFTGTHFGVMSKAITPEEGDIVVDGDTLVVSVSDSVCKSLLSSGPNQKGAVGVFTSEVVWHKNTALGDDYTLYEDNYNLIKFNGVGEGAINVCGEGGNISKGDLIVTSSMPGKGMRGDDDTPLPFVVAKAREAMTFSSPTEVKMVACIYLCG